MEESSSVGGGRPESEALMFSLQQVLGVETMKSTVVAILVTAHLR